MKEPTIDDLFDQYRKIEEDHISDDNDEVVSSSYGGIKSNWKFYVVLGGVYFLFFLILFIILQPSIVRNETGWRFGNLFFLILFILASIITGYYASRYLSKLWK